MNVIGKTIIRGGRLLDAPSHAAPRADILIDGDTIAEIGRPGLAAPDDATIVDAKGMLLYHIRLPYAVPFIFSGLKVAIALAVVGAVVGEFVNADEGLGYLIITATAFFKTPVAFGALILLSIMGIVLFQVVVIIERIFFPWSAANQETTIV